MEWLLAIFILFLLTRKAHGTPDNLRDIEQRIRRLEYIISRLHFELRREK
jgi:hypothetical protein